VRGPLLPLRYDCYCYYCPPHHRSCHASPPRPTPPTFRYAYGNVNLPDLVKADDVTDAQWAECDVAFCCLPHATTQKIIKELPETVRVVDLSADFRLFDTDVYEKWYGLPHAAVELQKEAVYVTALLLLLLLRPAAAVTQPLLRYNDYAYCSFTHAASLPGTASPSSLATPSRRRGWWLTRGVTRRPLSSRSSRSWSRSSS